MLFEAILKHVDPPAITIVFLAGNFVLDLQLVFDYSVLEDLLWAAVASKEAIKTINEGFKDRTHTSIGGDKLNE